MASHRCEEIGQDVFVVAFRKLSAFDPARSQFSTWLFLYALILLKLRSKL